VVVVMMMLMLMIIMVVVVVVVVMVMVITPTLHLIVGNFLIWLALCICILGTPSFNLSSSTYYHNWGFLLCSLVLSGEHQYLDTGHSHFQILFSFLYIISYFWYVNYSGWYNELYLFSLS
jgi:hypothetical protein